MTTNPKSAGRLPVLLSGLGILLSVLACMISGPEPTAGPEPGLRLGEGAIEGQNVNGEWMPVAVESSFEITSTLESMEPWQVAGATFEVNGSTEIESGLQIGDLVKVRGMILEDGTWVALSIERAEEQAGPTIILIGKVTSTDPWVVTGITLNVTEDTVISGDITVGVLVRVEILLAEDGTWEVLSIAPMGDIADTSGCVTVLATIVSVNGDEIQFLGWPTGATMDKDVQIGNDNSNEADTDSLDAGQTVLVTLCISADGQIIITQIVIVTTEAGDENASPGQEKVLICHKPDKNGGHTLSVAEPAVAAHLAHGDTLGACP